MGVIMLGESPCILRTNYALGVQRQLLTFVTGCPCGGVSRAFVVLQQIPLVPHNEIGGVQQGHGHGFKVDRVASYTANDRTLKNSIIIPHII